MKTHEWFLENMKDWQKPLSASGIGTALGCERKFLFANKWRLYRKARQYSASATFGKLLHRLLQVGRDCIEEVHQEVVKQHEDLLQQIREGEDLLGDITREANELNASYTKAVAVASIYWERFPPKDYMETVCREEKVEVTITEGTLMADFSPSLIGIPWVGYMDWVVRDKRDGSIWIRDTKTTGRSFASILTGFPYCIQCRFYRMLALLSKEWGGQVKGFILDMVKVPAIKMCGKDEKNAALWECSVMEAYIKRVKDWYAEQDEDSMRSEAVVFTEPVMGRELSDALHKTIKLWVYEALPENFSKDLTRSTCYAYEKECPYYVLCNSNPVTWPAIIEQMFEVVPEHKDRKEIT